MSKSPKTVDVTAPVVELDAVPAPKAEANRHADRPHDEATTAEHIESLRDVAEAAEKAGKAAVFTPAGHLRVDHVFGS